MFTTELVIKRPAGSKNRYELVQPLVWSGDGFMIVAPAGFCYDGASVPSVFSSIIPRFGARYDRAICLHDYLYSEGKISRADSDKIFYKALRSDKVCWAQAKIMYFAVRFFGKKHYKG